MENHGFLIAVLVTTITAATPLVYAALGELVVEKSGVLNLGVEGMMLGGALSAFGLIVVTGNPAIAIIGGALAGLILSLLFGVLTLTLMSNQVASGLALSIFGVGLTALIGENFAGIPYDGLPNIELPGLSAIPFIGPLLFQHDIMVYGSFLLPVAIWYFLTKTRAGMILRAVGENHDAAHSIGYPVVIIRYLAVMFGGAMAGLGGAYLSIAYTPHWAENMTAGRGWIALALVVFATWKPGRAFAGAYLFGGITIAQLHAQAFGVDIPSQVLSMLPYLVTIIVLVLISGGAASSRLNAPASLGKMFHAS